MRSVLVGLLVASLSLSACLGGGADAEGPATPSDCRFPEVDEVGSNAYYVGGVLDAQESPIAEVLVRALPVGGGEPSQDTTNQGGCFFLDLEPGAPYDVTASKTGYHPETKTDQSAAAGEKVVVTFVLERA